MAESELHFPDAYMLGTVSISPKNSMWKQADGGSEWDDWRYLAPARGTVHVPTGYAVCIQIDAWGHPMWEMEALVPVPTAQDVLAALQKIEPTSIERLNLTGLRDVPVSETELSVLSRFSNLRSLNMAGRELPADGFARLAANLPYLANLNTRWAPGLENFQALRMLSVFGDNFNDANVASLSQLPTLVSLWLDGKNLTGACLSHLATLTNLEELRMVGIPVEDGDLLPLSRLHNLNRITLEAGRLTDVAVKFFSQLTNLEYLDLFEARFSDDGFSELWKTFAHLSELVLAKSSVSSNGLSGFHRLANLQVLNLNFTGLTDSGLRQLGNVPRLHELRINGTPVRGEDGSVWSGLSGLRTLDLSGTQINDLTLREVVANLPGLETLYLNQTGISEKGLNFLAGLTHLKHLHLQAVPLSEVALKSLGRISSLEELVIDGSGISGDDLVSIAEMTDLRELMIDGLTRADKGLEALLLLKGLRWLRLIGCDVTDVGMAAIAQFEQLEGLSLLNNEITDAGLAYLNGGLPRLRSLDLTGNMVSVPTLNALYLARPETKIYAV